MAHSLAAESLGRYLDANKLTHQAFAELAELERSQITKVLSGQRRRFSPEAAHKIVKATKGKVTLEECLGLRSHKAA